MYNCPYCDSPSASVSGARYACGSYHTWSDVSRSDTCIAIEYANKENKKPKHIIVPSFIRCERLGEKQIVCAMETDKEFLIHKIVIIRSKKQSKLRGILRFKTAGVLPFEWSVHNFTFDPDIFTYTLELLTRLSISPGQAYSFEYLEDKKYINVMLIGEHKALK